MEIVTTILEHLNKGVNNILNRIHASYSAMKFAINNFDIDKEIAIPLMETWIPRL